MENSKISEHRNRLDVEMTARGLARSRSFAEDMIRRRKVRVNGAVASKRSIEVGKSDEISVDSADTFVSRAGEKLAHALGEWQIDATRLLTIDVGSSTGGFTDCLLRRGAQKVFAVDVGKDQFDKDLKSDPRVELHEGVDIRKFSLPSPVDLAVVDVSFISLSHVLPKVFELLKPGGKAIALVKPQFEVGAEAAKASRGVIKDETLRASALGSVKRSAQTAGFKILSHIDSPIAGEAGNLEYLLLLEKSK